ncbi:2-C-methyl-D-erythritol 2,4-cyclodiphosphate synthase, chloroplastic [Pyrus x bretschneideri]|uniref:2-C-methyl-D-erythritol 2,4-cyclodiphosphate synthase, chloroplastic n=1 Tax=Pyrus x bretschneideri TaxID=225117 RepID=UPI00202F1E9B|nr:2-C-methyl-D-erythritol 2,4-cyclodiphosphate synthase, chloroplastic [Pyrus x bretschneideri]
MDPEMLLFGELELSHTPNRANTNRNQIHHDAVVSSPVPDQPSAMAMAATPACASSITTATITKPLSRPLPCSPFPTLNPYYLQPSAPLSLRTPKTPRRPVFCASASTAFEVDQAPASATPSKLLPFRVGHGFDLHRLEPGYPLIIGGIDIPHDRGCEAHSDGDVLLHCVVDAILGALGLPDIGQIFPDSDPKWRGAASSVFIKEAVRLMHEAGYEIGNLDATLILQRPKLSPHKEVMRANLAKLLGADPSVVNLKAKTHEKVDSLGENRSIAAHTVVLLMRK